MSQIVERTKSICGQHGKEFQLYCPDCQVPLCESCIVTHCSIQKPHRIVPIQEVLLELNQKITQNQAVFVNKISIEQEQLGHSEKQLIKCENQAVTRVDLLRQIRERIIEIVLSEEAALSVPLLEQLESQSGVRGEL